MVSIKKKCIKLCELCFIFIFYFTSFIILACILVGSLYSTLSHVIFKTKFLLLPQVLKRKKSVRPNSAAPSYLERLVCK